MPAPDVLFGLDNVLQLDTAASLLQNYSSPGLSLLRPDIATALNLNNEPPLTPFDFGYIALTANMVNKYNKNNTNAIIYKDALANYTFEYGVVTSANFSLADFVVHSSLFPLLVIENPRTCWSVFFLVLKRANHNSHERNGHQLSHVDHCRFWRQPAQPPWPEQVGPGLARFLDVRLNISFLGLLNISCAAVPAALVLRSCRHGRKPSTTSLWATISPWWSRTPPTRPTPSASTSPFRKIKLEERAHQVYFY